MGDAVRRLIALAKVWVPPHMSITEDGKPFQVSGYWRRGGSAPSPQLLRKHATTGAEVASVEGGIKMRYTKGSSDKFWMARIVTTDSGFVVESRWGKSGTAGAGKDFVFPTKAAAQAYLDKKVKEKYGKGYDKVDELLGAEGALPPSAVKVGGPAWDEAATSIDAPTTTPKAPKAPKAKKAPKKADDDPIEIPAGGLFPPPSEPSLRIKELDPSAVPASYLESLSRINSGKLWDGTEADRPAAVRAVRVLNQRAVASVSAVLGGMGASLSRSFYGLTYQPQEFAAALALQDKVVEEFTSPQFQASLRATVDYLEFAKRHGLFDDEIDPILQVRVRKLDGGKTRLRLAHLLRASEIMAKFRAGEEVSDDDLKFLRDRFSPDKGTNVFGAFFQPKKIEVWGPTPVAKALQQGPRMFRGSTVAQSIWAPLVEVGRARRREFLEQRGLADADGNLAPPSVVGPGTMREALVAALLEQPLRAEALRVADLQDSILATNAFLSGTSKPELEQLVDTLTDADVRTWLRAELGERDAWLTASDAVRRHWAETPSSEPWRAGWVRGVEPLRRHFGNRAKFEIVASQIIAKVHEKPVGVPDAPAADDAEAKEASRVMREASQFRLRPMAKYVVSDDAVVDGRALSKGQVFEYDDGEWASGDDRVSFDEMASIAPFADGEGEDVPRELDAEGAALVAAAKSAGSQVGQQNDLMNAMKVAGGNYVGKMSLEEKRRWSRLRNSGLAMIAFGLEVQAAAKGKKPVQHKDFKTNPVSVGSPQGSVTAQALADVLAVQSWSPLVPLEQWTPQQRASAAELFGVDEQVPADSPFADLRDVVEVLRAMDLPSPSDELSPAVPQPEAARPAGVSERTWDLVRGIEASDFDPLQFTPDPPEDDATLLKLLQNFNPNNDGEASPEVRDAWKVLWSQTEPYRWELLPRQVRRMAWWQWKAQREKSSGTGAGFVAPPPDLLPAVAARLLQGAYDRPAAPGSYGAVNWDALKLPAPYLLERGDVALRPPVAMGVSPFVVVFRGSGDWVMLTEGSQFTATSTTAPSDDAAAATLKQLREFDKESSVPGSSAAAALEQLRRRGSLSDFSLKVTQALTPDKGSGIGLGAYVPDAVDVPPRKVRRADFDTDDALWDAVAALEKDGYQGSKEGPWFGVPSQPSMLRSQLVDVMPRRESALVPPAVLAYLAGSRASTPPEQFDALVRLVRDKVRAGAYGFRSPSVSPEASYFRAIVEGVPPERWGRGVLSEFIANNSLGDAKAALTVGDTAGAVALVSEKVDEMFGIIDASQPPPPTGAVVEQITLTKAKVQQKLGGMHAKSTYLDQLGRQWMVKQFPHDSASEARIDAEHNANLIGRSFGFRQPQTDARKLDGVYSYAQLLKDPNAKSFAEVSFGDLTDIQLREAAEEHVLDWLLSNHDTHDANLLIGDDGRVFGIDKGQSWKFFPDDKLAVGYEPNPQPAWYDRLYRAVQDGKISKERADKIAKGVLVRAVRVSTRRDEETRKLLEAAFAKRTNFPKGMSREQFVDAVMARKAGLAQDFEKLWKGIYEKAGYEWTLPPLEQLAGAKVEVETPSGPVSVYSALSQSVIEETERTQVHGASFMLASPHVDEGHVVLWREKTAGGEQVVGELRVRQLADQAIVKWIKDHTITDATVTAGMIAAEEPDDLPNNAAWASAVTIAAKTVNVHQADGEYNAGAIASLTAELDLMKKWAAGESLPSGLSPEEQQGVKEMADYYRVIAEQVLAAKDKGEKTPSKSYAKFAYKPKKKATAATGEWQGGLAGDMSLKVLSDGTYELTLGTQVTYAPDPDDPDPTDYGVPKWVLAKFASPTKGAKATLTAEEAKDLLALESQNWAEASVMTATSLAGKQFKVFVRKNRRVSGTYDVNTGVLNADVGSVVELPGKQYDIEVGDLVIEYRPFTGMEVPRSEWGMMRFRVKNFDGSEGSVQDALDTIQSMGVSMQPADEESLELLYWQLQTAQLSNREADRKPEQTAMLAALKTDLAPHLAGNDPGVLLPIFRKHWATLIGQDRVVEADYMPRFETVGSSASGKPTWVRPDVTEQELREAGMKRALLPAHALTDQGDANLVARMGLLSTEERLRVFGKWKKGSSSESDMLAGSACFVFMSPNGKGWGEAAHVVIDPAVFARTFTYAQDTDTYGRAERRPESKWTASSMLSARAEGMLKYGVAPRDFLAARVPDPAATVKWFADRGVTEFDGIPVERIFMGPASTPSDRQQRAKENLALRIAYFQSRGVK